MPVLSPFRQPANFRGNVEMVPPVGLTLTQEIEMMRNVLLVRRLTGSGCVERGGRSAQRSVAVSTSPAACGAGYAISGTYGYSPRLQP